MNRLLLLFLIGILQSGCSLIFHSPPKETGEDTETSPKTPDKEIADVENEDEYFSLDSSSNSDQEETNPDKIEPESQTKTSEEESERNPDLFVSAMGKDTERKKQIAATQRENKQPHIFVSPYGNNKNLGSQEKPLRSLTEAIKQAEKMQKESNDEEILIQLDKGTYSQRSGEDEEITIPSGISIIGNGESTILLANLKTSANVSLENLQLKDYNIVTEENIEAETQLKDLSINNGSVKITSSNVRLSNIELKGSDQGDFLAITSGSPQLENIKLSNSSENSKYYYKLGILIVSEEASPQIQNLTINDSLLGIYNQGNTTIAQLNLSENRAGIYNQGELTIENFTLTQPKESHYGICNQDQGTIFIQTANLKESATTQADNCEDYAGDPYPDTIPELAGNHSSIFIENWGNNE